MEYYELDETIREACRGAAFSHLLNLRPTISVVPLSSAYTKAIENLEG